MKIPEQLREQRFIFLGLESKNPLPGRVWSDAKNQYTAEEIEKQSSLFPGHNYGVLLRGDYAVLDADDAGTLETCGFLDLFRDTFTVMSGRATSTGLHCYFRIPDAPAPGKIILKDKETGGDLGDIRLPGSRFYTVGPGSVHPASKKPYTVFVDAPVRLFSWTELQNALSRVSWSMPKKPETQKNASSSSGRSGRYTDCGVSVLDFLMPLNPHPRGGEIEGGHPIHGSTTGSNLTVKSDGSQWYCRRCGTGGGWIEALAVSERIIDCSEAGQCFTRDEWKEIRQILREKHPAAYRTLLREHRGKEMRR